MRSRRAAVAPSVRRPTDRRSRQTARKRLTPDNALSAPRGPGVYLLFGSQGAVAYVGRTHNLRARLIDCVKRRKVPAAWFAVKTTSSVAEAKRLEHDLIERHGPTYNIAAA